MNRVYVHTARSIAKEELARLVRIGRELGDVVIGMPGDFPDNLHRYRPQVVLAFDEWQTPGDRDRVLAAVAVSGGRLIEVPASGLPRTGHARSGGLRRVLETQDLVRVIEAHSPLSAVIASRASVEVAGVVRSFDALWASSLTNTAQAGLPDTGLDCLQRRMAVVTDVVEAVSLPVVFDADSGGSTQQLVDTVGRLEAMGVSAAIVEDKTGPKRNSLYGTAVEQRQEQVEVFADKLAQACVAAQDPDFMVIARVESLILEQGLDDALMRAHAYVKAGAHGVMIHSRSSRADEVLEFARVFRLDHPHVPLVAVPTTYCGATEAELVAGGFSMVIYANHLQRAAHLAMDKTARSILHHGRALETEGDLTPIPEFLGLFETDA